MKTKANKNNNWRLGPIFNVECVLGARRKRLYVGRALFVLILLYAVSLIWLPLEAQTFVNIGELSSAGQNFFRVIVACELALVLLVAPAATAGAICVDKARGSLAHVFTTDLSDREIVFGKLFARLVPIGGWILCGIPVLALSGLSGGVDATSSLAAALVVIGSGAICCSLALFISIWAKKPYQALLAAYLIEAVWLLAKPLLEAVAAANPYYEDFFYVFNHNRLASMNPIIFLRDQLSTGVSLSECVLFFAVSVTVAFTIAWSGSRNLRRVVLTQSGAPIRRDKPGFAAKMLAKLPEPSIDADPVLWREWHRKRPGKWVGRFWVGYVVVLFFMSLLAIVNDYLSPGVRSWSIWSGPNFAGLVNGAGVSLGLLLLSISAATALAEERDRGSLDVVMTTDLSTAEIVRGKWWGTFAMVPRLAILPCWVCGGLAMLTSNYLAFFLMVALLLSHASLIVSLGLAIATWVPRLSRAVGLSVAAYVFLSVGWAFVLFGVSQFFSWTGLVDRDFRLWDGLLMALPFQGIHRLTFAAGRLEGIFNGSAGVFGGTYYYRALPETQDEGLWTYAWPLVWIVANFSLSMLVYICTLRSFDRLLGRAPAKSRSRPMPTLAQLALAEG